jgi:phosphate starvation-inducible PhoH-like protein
VWVARNQQQGANVSRRKKNNGNGVSTHNRVKRVNNRDRRVYVEPKTEGQRIYLSSIHKNKLTVCDGPAGCGKTLLAAASAVKLLNDNTQYDHIVIVRPAITACNERIGFLPGNIDDKMEPFTMPVLYSLSKVVGREYFQLLMKNEVIKVIPMAFMRGLTLENCVVLLDEAQNTTPEQMKMFLTRIGENCKVIVEGDETQSDIKRENGLKDALDRLENMSDVGVVIMEISDVLRSSFVSHILERYEK